MREGFKRIVGRIGKTGTVQNGRGHLATSVGLCSVVSLVPKDTSLSRLLDEDFFPTGFGVFGGLKQGLDFELALALALAAVALVSALETLAVA